MQPECPEWAAYIGLAVRLITNEMKDEPRAMLDVLKRLQEREVAVRRDPDDEARGEVALP